MASEPLPATDTVQTCWSHPLAGSVVGWFCPLLLVQWDDFSFFRTLLPLTRIIISYRQRQCHKGDRQ
jgi:hypothetical protein